MLGAVTLFVVSAVWYGALFAKPWMRALGIDGVEPGGNVPLIFAGAFVLEVLAAIELAAVIGSGAIVASASATGTAAGILIAGTTLSVQYLCERRQPVLCASTRGHAVAGFTAMGAVIGTAH